MLHLMQDLFSGRRDLIESVRLMFWRQSGFKSKMFWGIYLHIFNASDLIY